MKKSAFRAFYSKTVETLSAYVRYACGDSDLADDLTHEAYLRFLTAKPKRRTFQHDKNYLYKIATNLVRDHWRSAVRHRNLAHFSLEDNPTTNSNVDLQMDLSAALSQLRTRERAALWLAYVEGLTRREIASVLGIEEGSVRVLLYRARRKAAELLKKSG